MNAPAAPRWPAWARRVALGVAALATAAGLAACARPERIAPGTPAAEVLHTLGYQVQGSDLAESGNVQRLQGVGIPVAVGHDAEPQALGGIGDIGAVFGRVPGEFAPGECTGRGPDAKRWRHAFEVAAPIGVIVGV